MNRTTIGKALGLSTLLLSLGCGEPAQISLKDIGNLNEDYSSFNNDLNQTVLFRDRVLCQSDRDLLSLNTETNEYKISQSLVRDVNDPLLVFSQNAFIFTLHWFSDSRNRLLYFTETDTFFKKQISRFIGHLPEPKYGTYLESVLTKRLQYGRSNDGAWIITPYENSGNWIYSIRRSSHPLVPEAFVDADPRTHFNPRILPNNRVILFDYLDPQTKKVRQKWFHFSEKLELVDEGYFGNETDFHQIGGTLFSANKVIFMNWSEENTFISIVDLEKGTIQNLDFENLPPGIAPFFTFSQKTKKIVVGLNETLFSFRVDLEKGTLEFQNSYPFRLSQPSDLDRLHQSTGGALPSLIDFDYFSAASHSMSSDSVVVIVRAIRRGDGNLFRLDLDTGKYRSLGSEHCQQISTGVETVSLKSLYQRVIEK